MGEMPVVRSDIWVFPFVDRQRLAVAPSLPGSDSLHRLVTLAVRCCGWPGCVLAWGPAMWRRGNYLSGATLQLASNAVYHYYGGNIVVFRVSYIAL
jgi:hypothetical protein